MLLRYPGSRASRWAACCSPSAAPRAQLRRPAARPRGDRGRGRGARDHRVGRVQRPLRGGASRWRSARGSAATSSGSPSPRAARCSKGDVLFEIDARPYRAELARAQGELAQARSAAALAARDRRAVEAAGRPQAISREDFDNRTTAAERGGAAVRRRRGGGGASPASTSSGPGCARPSAAGWAGPRSPRATWSRPARRAAAADHGGLARPDLRQLRRRRAQLPEVRGPRAPGRPGHGAGAPPITLGLSDEEGFPARGLRRLRRQPARSRAAAPSGRGRCSPTRTGGSRPGCSPASSWRAAASTRPRWSPIARSAPTRTRSSCWCSRPTAPSSTGRSSWAGWWTATGW